MSRTIPAAGASALPSPAHLVHAEPRGPDLAGLLDWLGMHPDLTTIRGIEDLDRVLDQSADQPVLIFKHSYSCGVSAEALDELVAHLNDRDHKVTVAMVTVQTHRDVSNAVTARLGIRHETPQALLVRNGRVVWSASHFRVTSHSMQQAIRSHTTIAAS